MTNQTDNQQPSLDIDQCRICGENKPLDQFVIVNAVKSRGKKYRSHICIVCNRKGHTERERKRRVCKNDEYRAYCRKWHHTNKAKRKISQRKKYLKLKDEVFKAYGGYMCVCCGETEHTMLNMDHINNDGADHRKKLKLTWSGSMYQWIKDNGFPATFQVLCYNCNLSKHRNGGICAHNIKEGSSTRA